MSPNLLSLQPLVLGRHVDGADLRISRSIVASELRMLILDVTEMGLDEDTAEFVIDSARKLISRLDDAVKDREISKVESDLGRLQVVVHQALKRKGEG